MANPRVFISYSHDDEAHKAWVLRLATALREQGVDAILDQWDLTPGQDLAAFMQHGIADSDRVVMVCSEKYVSKAEAGVGGVGVERLIVTAEVSANTDTKKFVPIVRANSKARKVPIFLGSRLYIDFEDDNIFASALEELARDLHGIYKLEKPALGTPTFALAPSPASPPSAGPMTRSLDDEWFAAQAARADEGLSKLGFNGSMEVRSVPEHGMHAAHTELLNASEASKIRTFGWPIGVTLNRDGCSPRPSADGIRTEVSIPKNQSVMGHSSYDYWALANDGRFYTQLSLFEDDRGSGLIFFNTRIIRVAESIMFLTGVYERLNLPRDVAIRFRVRHKGLAGRQLQSAGGNRAVFPRGTEEDQSQTEISFTLKEAAENLPALVQSICAPMFVLFDFMEFNEKIYNDIVTRFQAGETS